MLGPRSERALQGVHPALQGVIRAAAARLPLPGDLGFVVTEGLRSVKRQEALVVAGASRTMNSRHLTGHAVDLAATLGGVVAWDWPLYAQINDAVQQAARALGVRVTWGGAWKRFPDGPHFEIDPATYPHEVAHGT